jgi:NTP pyrophosphatase (non-canonical NTP hydrolase)
MTSDEYIQNCMRTASVTFKAAVPPQVIHGIEGCVTEAGELMDALKKTEFYGKPFDPVNICEEIGDIMWFLSLICNYYGWSFSHVWEINIAKLKKRYPEKFTSEKALNRDLEAEREVLEGREDNPADDLDVDMHKSEGKVWAFNTPVCKEMFEASGPPPEKY